VIASMNYHYFAFPCRPSSRATPQTWTRDRRNKK